MAEYLILIYEDENGYATATPDVFQQVMEAHNRFAEQVGEKGGKIIGGNALQPTGTATTIRSDVVTDGPFVETKEALGGYYLIEARDLDHALDIAKLCPAPFGGVEVRPIMDFSQGPSTRGAEQRERRTRRRADDAAETPARRAAIPRAAVADAHRREWAFVLAATARVAGDIDLAEECVQDAYVAALDAWSRQGVPRNPGAWLTTAARRRAIDALRREADPARQAPAAGRARSRRSQARPRPHRPRGRTT